MIEPERKRFLCEYPRGTVLQSFDTLREAYGFATSSAHPSIRRFITIWDREEQQRCFKRDATVRNGRRPARAD